MVLLLFESAAGFALFKVLDEGKLKEAETQDVWSSFETLDAAKKVVKLKAFSKFENTADALQAAASLVDSKVSKSLKKFLKKHAGSDTLAVLDAKLGNVIKEKLEIPCVYSTGVSELTRGVRNQLGGLLAGLGHEADLRPMSLGLSHSLSRYKLKFSPDKVDTMIIQAIGLLDDLDKELNTYAMRVREWYGWHFPEMTKIVGDNIAYAKTVKLMGTREKAADLDFSDFLEEEVSEEDVLNVGALCDQVIALSDYRGQLYDYLKSRMAAIAPNLTVLVGELVGARLIAHVGSLVNLAKAPASTIQILGAEKALFRALKTKHETPKYGLIYHASLIGQAAPKNKGKISRVLAAKCALGVRVDALADVSDNGAIGLEARTKVEARLRQLEGRQLEGEAARPRGLPGAAPYDAARQGAAPTLLTTPKAYNADADVVAATTEKKKKKKREAEADVVEAEEPTKKKKKKKSGDAGVAVNEEEAEAANGLENGDKVSGGSFLSW
ncbi:putative nucleolar protein 5-2 [Auxenochlorella protothecoides]|uniref:Nucleolar protein 58 n=1 Tax=Auxenochlorella protothecoides TaxID=3075 RepID=A0A087SL20_AUXPR|nr:putative nucleolar protein 5-2 [Auxenochlorella protothecoides]KFM26424.1 putative nucleolar protein 5-2 [Auxenochlorella protothecoides]